MAEESDCEITKSSENDAQPSSSKRIFDQKTPHLEKHCVYPNSVKKSRLSEVGDIWIPSETRGTPLPYLSWANSKDVWQMMVYKEEATARNRNCRLFEDPNSFLPRMRSILVDWIMEVCEAYHLRRATFYLALDYIDRYLSINPSVPKNQLQLIGITSLFIAAKLEEVYPPKLSEFSYVCDGACSQEDIVDCEILLLTSLAWDLNFMTPTAWLNLYMQIHAVFENRDKEDSPESNFVYPQYSPYCFVGASHLIDLFTLDPGYLLFSYSVIAAASVYFIYGKSVALQVSGLQWDDLKDCAEYMAVYYAVLSNTDDPRLQSIIHHERDYRQILTYEALRICVPNVTISEAHTVQTHFINMQHFEQATLLRLQQMGLTVEKSYVPIQPNEETDDSFSMYEDEDDEMGDDENEENDSDDHEQDGDGNKDETKSISKKKINEDDSDSKRALLMFEIEDHASCDYTKDNNLTENESTSFFTTKKKYTFDEILIGIHQRTNKRISETSSQVSCSNQKN